VIGTILFEWGGFLEHRQFDPSAFGISPREAQSMDPHSAYARGCEESLEDAGQLETDMRGSATGVFVGVSTWDYSLLQYASQTEHRVDSYSATGWPSPSSPIDLVLL